jgi:putative transposase
MIKFKKCKRFNCPGHAHELTFSCYKNLPLLSDEEACKFLAQAIVSARGKHKFNLLAYVFMPDHVHLLIMPQKIKYSISNILQSIKQAASRRILSHYKRFLPDKLTSLQTGDTRRQHKFWQEGGGYDRNIFSMDAIKSSIDYIHNNPVKRGLVSNPGDWLWSSYKDWMGMGTGPIPIEIENIPLL